MSVQVHLHQPTGEIAIVASTKNTSLKAIARDCLEEIGLPDTPKALRKIRLLKDGHKPIENLNQPLKSLGVKCVGADSGVTKWKHEVQ